MGLALLVAFSAISAAGAGVGLRLQEAGELPYEDATRLVAELGRALEDACGRPVAIDDPIWSRCSGDEQCIAQIRERTRAGDVVLVRVFGSLTIARVVTERFVDGEKAPRRAEIDVPRDASAWRERLEELADLVCPASEKTKIVQSPVIEKIETTPPAQPFFDRALPWMILGAGALAAAAGVGFGISSSNARSDSQNPAISQAEFEELADRTQAHAIAADVLFVAAAAGVAAGIVLFASE